MNIYIGENIKRLRLRKGITQEQLSVAAGVSCAAVSKWERENTLPDISQLPVLANYFGVSIDELMGYDAARIENEILCFIEEHNRLRKAGKVREYTTLSKKAYRDYPNDPRVMHLYMWDKAGDYADNDPAVILANKDELNEICQKILSSSSDIYLKLDAINMQGKILHAEGRTEEAAALYEKEFPDWYQTRAQKTEQLFDKSTPEFARHLKCNMLELGSFALNKKSKELWFCHHLSLSEKGEAALAVCAALESLRGTAFLWEMDYYLAYFANEMALKMKLGGDLDTAERLRDIAQEARQRFADYSRTDPDITEYCEKLNSRF